MKLQHELLVAEVRQAQTESGTAIDRFVDAMWIEYEPHRLSRRPVGLSQTDVV